VHTIVWIPMVFAAIAAWAVVSALSRRERALADSDGQAIQQLRAQALFADPASVGIRPLPASAWGVVMDSAYDGGCISLVSLLDGSTSVYFQSGGGMIGAGMHERVRSASRELVRTAESLLGEMTPATSTGYPAAGQTRFFVRTDSALLSAEAAETELGDGMHPLSALFYAGQDVLAAVREETSAPAVLRPRSVDQA
jgi:hypothetical protein